MTNQFSLVDHGGVRVLSILDDNFELRVVTDQTHSNITEMVEALLVGEFDTDMLDIGALIEKKFHEVTVGRVSVPGATVYFDDDPIRGKITERILHFLENGHPIEPLVKFLDNIMANPQEHSREQFYRWIENHDFPIDDDGCIVAFKGVTREHKSLHSGKAFVDGVEFNGQIPNKEGSVITMPRSEVQHNPSVACHTGLHAGTWSYASGFAPIVMHVKINPRDVVSVPNDCSSQKVRVCRYEVMGFAESDHDGLYYAPEFESLDDEDDDLDVRDEDTVWYLN